MTKALLPGRRVNATGSIDTVVADRIRQFDTKREPCQRRAAKPKRRRADGQGPGHIIDVGWITGSPEPDLVLRPNYYSKFALINGVNDPEIDASLDKERGAETAEERKKILQEDTLPLLAAKVPSLSLFSAVSLRAMSKNLEGAYFYPNGPIDLSKAKLF